MLFSFPYRGTQIYKLLAGFVVIENVVIRCQPLLWYNNGTYVETASLSTTQPNRKGICLKDENFVASRSRQL